MPCKETHTDSHTHTFAKQLSSVMRAHVWMRGAPSNLTSEDRPYAHRDVFWHRGSNPGLPVGSTSV